ncbi:MAG: hypothetical protein IJ525_05920 [Alphaproteobacteria bacterium]|nr:hypothetical protein [Alphaproteobacteria bacterium]
MSKIDNKEELKADEIVKNTSILPKNKENNKTLPLITIFLLLVISGLSAVGVYEYRKLKSENEKNIADMTHKMNSLANYVDGRLAFVNENVEKLKNDMTRDNREKDLKRITDVAITTLENQLAQLKMQITQELENKIDQNIASAKSETIIKKEETRIAQETLLASGALVVRDLAELGEDFRYECEVMQVLAQGNELAQNYTAALRIHALNGVNGKNKLIKDFNKVYANLGETKLKPENALVKDYTEMDWAEKIIYYLRKYSILKKAARKPQFKAQEDEVYRLVNEGELREALTAIKNSEKYNKIDSAPLNEWMKNTENYLDFRHLIDSLLMNSLANLHLKEMEH